MRTRTAATHRRHRCRRGGLARRGKPDQRPGTGAGQSGVRRGARRKRRPRHHRPVRRGRRLAEADVGAPGPRGLDAGARSRASSPRARTASTWCSAASCRCCSVPPPAPFRISAPACRSRWARCRSETPRRAPHRARPEPADPAPTLTIRSSNGGDAWASTPAGSTRSSSSTPPATSSKRGRSGTR